MFWAVRQERTPPEIGMPIRCRVATSRNRPFMQFAAFRRLNRRSVSRRRLQPKNMICGIVQSATGRLGRLPKNSNVSIIKIAVIRGGAQINLADLLDEGDTKKNDDACRNQ